MAAVINMDDPAHQEAYWFFKRLHDADAVTWVTPGLLFFELQATRARRHRQGIDALPVYGNIPLYVDTCELYEVDSAFLRKVWEQDLYRKLGTLKGSDLLYASIACIERVPLVTLDSDFNRHRDLLAIIDPRVEDAAT